MAPEKTLLRGNAALRRGFLSVLGVGGAPRGARGGSELSSSSKVRDFAPDFQSSKKFEVREQVHEPKKISFFNFF